MGLDRITASGILKEDYQPLVRTQIDSRSEWLNQIERNSDDVEGLEAVFSLHVGRNSGIGSRKELEILPDAGNQSYVKARVGLKYHYGRIQVSGPIMRAAKSDAGSFVRAVESESKGIVTDLRFDHERQLLGTSDGVLAATGVTTGSTNVVTTATTTQIRHIRPGMKVDIGTVANPTAVVAGSLVTAVNSTTKVVTISSAVTTAATDRIFLKGNGGSGANQREVTGLQTIINNTAPLFGVDPAVNPEWASYVRDAGGAALSDAIIGELIDEVGIVSPTGPSQLGLVDHRQARVYGASLTSLKQTVNSLDLKGGFKALEASTGSGTLALFPLRDAPTQTLLAPSVDNIRIHQASDWEFMDEDGAVLNRVPNVDGYEATLFRYDEQTTDVRRAHGRINNLAA